MQNFYMDSDHAPAVSVDLVDAHEIGYKGWLITRIYSPEAIRGQGRASRLLDRVCADADAAGLTLYLEINPYGGLTMRQLEEWYTRKGFRWNGCFWKRRPHRLKRGV